MVKHFFAFKGIPKDEPLFPFCFHVLQVQFGKEFLFCMIRQFERFSVDKAVIAGVLDQFALEQDMVPFPELMRNNPGFRFPVIEKTVIMIADIIVMVVDRQMTEEQEKNFILGPHVVTLQFLAE
jgi:hypothetical protein